MTIEEKENPPQSDNGSDIMSVIKKLDSHEEVTDIISILKKHDYVTVPPANGMTVGIRFQGVPHTRGVHADVVFVLDLREMSYSRAQLSMKTALLDKLNRGVEVILKDMDAADRYNERVLRTVKGKIRLQMLKSKNLRSCSLLHETRTIYIVTPEGGSTVDFSWLQENKRMVTINEFPTKLFELKTNPLSQENMQKLITSEKWDSLQIGYVRGIWAVLGFILAGIGAFSVWGAAMENSSSILGLGAIFVGTALGLVLLTNARNLISEFIESIENEHNLLAETSDGLNIQKAITDLEDENNLIKDLIFTVSSWMAAACNAIESGSIDLAVEYGRKVIEECIKGSSDDETGLSEEVKVLKDSGLKRLIGLIERLGVKTEGMDLQVAYLALTGHAQNALDFKEVVTHLGALSQAFYEAGIIKPDTKDMIDDMLGKRSGYVTIKEGFKELDESPDLPSPESGKEVDDFDDISKELQDMGSPEAPVVEESPEADKSMEPKPEEEVVEEPTVVAEESVEKYPTADEAPTDLSKGTRTQLELEVFEEGKEFPQTAEEVLEHSRKSRIKESMLVFGGQEVEEGKEAEV
jgi:hypothetical protein